MPKCAIVYFSQDGSTAKVADAIARGLGAGGYQVRLCNIRNEKPPDLNGFDLFGIGTPVYYFRPPFNVMSYLNGLPALTKLPVFFFLLHGTYPGDAVLPMRRALASKGAQEVGYFHCHGPDFFFGYLKNGFLFSPDHPTANELARAEAFGWKVALGIIDRPDDERPLPWIYRLERFLISRWLVRQVYSRFFRKTKDDEGL